MTMALIEKCESADGYGTPAAIRRSVRWSERPVALLARVFRIGREAKLVAGRTGVVFRLPNATEARRTRRSKYAALAGQKPTTGHSREGEECASNPQVAGSNPAGGARFSLQIGAFLCVRFGSTGIDRVPNVSRSVGLPRGADFVRLVA